MAALVYNRKLFNPLFWHVQKYLNNEAIRFMFIEGGSSAAKTFSIAQALLFHMVDYGVNTMVYRQFGVHIKDTVFQSFKKAANELQMKRFLEVLEMKIRYQSEDKMIRFRGLDDTESMKGLEDYDIVYCNEWNQQNKAIWDQLRKRLRGRRNQKYICDWNPVSAQLWQYTELIDMDEWIDLPLNIADAPTKYSSLNAEHSFVRINKAGNSIWIKTTYRDNFYIIGHPSGDGGFFDEHTLADYEYDRTYNPNLYRIYANGERGVLKTGGEFWKQFDEIKNVKPLIYQAAPVHISLDNNVNPYVTVGIWQHFNKDIKQIDELPCRTPDNNAPKAALRTVKYLRSKNHSDMVYIYGDPSALAASTVDEDSKSFFDKFIAVLKNANFKVVSRVGESAPEVAMSAAFINDIYESNLYGYTITISDNCRVSIDDYIQVKEDTDGSMKKPKVKHPVTNITYEPHGHFSDQKRYFIIQLLKEEFKKYKSLPKTNLMKKAGYLR
jgi:phage terminase large subunit